MEFEYNTESKEVEIFFNTDDICIKCSQQQKCPLLKAISNNVVYPFCDALDIVDCVAFNKN